MPDTPEQPGSELEQALEKAGAAKRESADIAADDQGASALAEEDGTEEAGD
jgi:hypothetical protein